MSLKYYTKGNNNWARMEIFPKYLIPNMADIQYDVKQYGGKST